jgi:hypothetical protein
MIKKIMLASCLLVASMASQAALISYNGYERDTAKNYVTGGGLEWLMWDVTKGQSINEALAAYGGAGWKLASNTQVASMFNTFKFNNAVWSIDESVNQYAPKDWGPEESGPYFEFINLFGATYTMTQGWAPNDPWTYARAFFGSDANNNGLYSYAEVKEDDFYVALSLNIPREAEAKLTRDIFNSSEGYRDTGVALVRDIRVLPPSQVSLPGSLSLLALGLVALGFRRRQA